jgi:hypothetical protein
VGWECGDCSRGEDDEVKVEWACHHCGKLLCQDDRHVLRDDAFSGRITSPRRRAVHCRECRDTYHSTRRRLFVR